MGNDTGKNIAIVALVGAGAFGIYKILTRPPEVPEVPEGDWGSADVILAKQDFSVQVTSPAEGDWRPANSELASRYFSIEITSPGEGDWRPADSELARKEFSVNVTVGEVPGKEPPTIEADVEDKTSSGATLVAELISEGYCSGAYCYFEWGTSTSYGNKSGETRLQPGRSMSLELSNLKPNTKYYYRAVAEGRCVTPYLVDEDTGSFTTKTAEILQIDDISYRKNGKSYGEPQKIYIGDEVGVQFNYKNTSSKTVVSRADLTIYSRGYTSAGRIGTSSGDKTMTPGDIRAIHLEFVADVVSDWTAKLVLKADGITIYNNEILIGWGYS